MEEREEFLLVGEKGGMVLNVPVACGKLCGKLVMSECEVKVKS
jgi:hypothetical protein